MFEKVKQAIHVGRHVTDMMRLPCVYSCHKVLIPLWQGGAAIKQGFLDEPSGKAERK